jgi:polyisoprenoid-binding protein YceI
MALWKLDPAHTSVKFSVKHMMIAKVYGSFDQVSGQLTYEVNTPESAQVDVHIDVNSVHTGDQKRDEHLKSADFFDAKKNPEIVFTSKHIEKKGDENFKVTGDLKIHNVTKEVVLDTFFPAREMKDPFGAIRLVASATTTVNRKDFGLGWNATLEAGGVLVGEDVVIAIDVQFVKSNM